MKKLAGRRFKTATEFGASLGLSDLDMELIRQKKRIIEKLKRARIRKKISQSQLAFLVGSKQPAIARMESGQVSEVSMDFLFKIAATLNISLIVRPFKDAA